jgi:hypothetical protein
VFYCFYNRCHVSAWRGAAESVSRGMKETNCGGTQSMDCVDDMNKNSGKAEKDRAPFWQPALTITAAVAALIVGLSLASCSSLKRATPEQAAAPTAVTLVAGDVIKLTFPGAPELNQAQKIRTDGKVNLPLVGEVAASGKTVPDLKSELAQRYKAELKTST